MDPTKEQEETAPDASGEGETPESAPKESPPVRRPMNAFLIFCKRHRALVREKNAHLDNRSVTRILGELWAALDPNAKSTYIDLAKEYKEAFMKANPNYKWYSPDKHANSASNKMPSKPPNAFAAFLPDQAQVKEPITPGKLADPTKMGGLSMLLTAGQQSEDGIPTITAVATANPNVTLELSGQEALQMSSPVSVQAVSAALSANVPSSALSTPAATTAGLTLLSPPGILSTADQSHGSVFTTTSFSSTIPSPHIPPPKISTPYILSVPTIVTSSRLSHQSQKVLPSGVSSGVDNLKDLSRTSLESSAHMHELHTGASDVMTGEVTELKITTSQQAQPINMMMTPPWTPKSEGPFSPPLDLSPTESTKSLLESSIDKNIVTDLPVMTPSSVVSHPADPILGGMTPKHSRVDAKTSLVPPMTYGRKRSPSPRKKTPRKSTGSPRARKEARNIEVVARQVIIKGDSLVADTSVSSAKSPEGSGVWTESSRMMVDKVIETVYNKEFGTAEQFSHKKTKVSPDVDVKSPSRQKTVSRKKKKVPTATLR